MNLIDAHNHIYLSVCYFPLTLPPCTTVSKLQFLFSPFSYSSKMKNALWHLINSKSLDYPISLPFTPRPELNTDRIMGEVQRVLQSNENINLLDGIQVHLVQVNMLQGGDAVGKRKY